LTDYTKETEDKKKRYCLNLRQTLQKNANHNLRTEARTYQNNFETIFALINVNEN